MLKKCDISNNNSQLKCVIAVTGALDGVTTFLCLKDVTNTCKRMRRSLKIVGNSSVQWRKVGRS